MPEADGGALVVQGAAIVPIELRGTGNTAGVKIPADVMGYFNVTRPTAAAPETKLVTRGAYTRRSYKGIDDTTGENSTVRASTWAIPLRAPSGRSGVPVVIPTELKTPGGHIRKVTLRFPAKCTVAEISNFLATKFTAKTPNVFHHNGVPYPVMRITNLGTALPPLPKKTTPATPA